MKIKCKIIDNLDVYPKDIDCMDWHEATQACKELGDGWRLPTKEELNVICSNRESIGGFCFSAYWSSSEFGADRAWTQHFHNGFQQTNDKPYTFSVRPVRDIPKETAMSGLETYAIEECIQWAYEGVECSEEYWDLAKTQLQALVSRIAKQEMEISQKNMRLGSLGDNEVWNTSEN